MQCNRRYVLTFLVWLCLLLSPAFSQPITLVWHALEDSTTVFFEAQKLSKDIDVIEQISRTIPQLQDQGYLAASIDSVAISGSRYTVYYHAGNKYQLAEIKLDAQVQRILVSANVAVEQYYKRALQPKTIARLSEKILQHCEDNGYPFARVWLEDVAEISPQRINATLRIDRAEIRRIDSIIVEGEVDISPTFLHRYLDIAKGSLYSEKKLKAISNKLRDLAFLEEDRPWEISFRPGDTRLVLYLKDKKANQLNAILGLMPNNLQAQKLLLTADVQFALQNFLSKGELISASFQNLQVRSPRIKADVVVPYLLKSPIGAELHFDFFSNNLQFRKVSFQAGARYQLSGNDFVRIFYQGIGNRILDIDSTAILASRQLPANIDAQSNGLGFEVQNYHLDSRLNPRKGWLSKLTFTAMNRKVITNNSIVALNDGTGFDFARLYDSVARSSNQYQFVAELAEFVPLSRIATLKIGYNGGYIAAPKVFQNELFQIGGFRLLRGFDEQSIFSNQYHIGVVELRLHYGPNSYVYLFSDNAWVQTKFHNYERSAMYNGFGLGTSLATKTGLFSIALAYGRNDYLPLRFRESKISFGYIALF